MADILQMTLLFDFYGELLTEKQKMIFEMYYLNDFSLSEIGDELSISRQAVRDQIKRTEKILLTYEQKLSLVKRFNDERLLVREIKTIIEELEKNNEFDKPVIEEIEKIKEISDKILN